MSRDKRPNRPHRRPFWLPASTFYFLTAAVTICVFFLTWAILAEAKEENPWIAAGLMASAAMVAGVVLREIILARRRQSLYAAQRQLDTAVLSMPVPVKREQDANKLTLERNKYLVDEIVKKSDAAKVLGHLSESHREVFALCEQYIEVAKRELPNVGVGSPRLAAIKRGRDKAERLHEYHMLKWAELEIQANTVSSDDLGSAESVQSARKALRVAETALSRYPGNPVLAESRAAIQSYIASGKLRELTEHAERAEREGRIDEAMNFLIEARELIMSDTILGGDDGRLETISSQIDRMSQLSD